MVTVIAKSNSRTKSLLSSVAEVSAVVSMLAALSGCVSLDLFGGDKVDRSLSTASVPNQQNGSAQTDDVTIRNAVTSADLAKLADQPLPWANAATGSAGVVTAIHDNAPLLRRGGSLFRTGLPVGNRRMVDDPLRAEIICLPFHGE